MITSRPSSVLCPSSSDSPSTYTPVAPSTVAAPPHHHPPAARQAQPGFSRMAHQPGFTTPTPTQARVQPQVCAPVPATQSIEEALDKLDAELEGHMQAEERRKRAREEEEETEKKRREEECRKRREWERQQEDKRKKEEEERKRRELERKERKRRELERKEEEERKRREWERQEEERKRQEEKKRQREWERKEEKKRQREWERQEEEKRRMQQLQQTKRAEQEANAKGRREQTAMDNLERLLAGSSSPTPAPPRLSSITPAPPAPATQASPPYPWLSRGGVLPCPPSAPVPNAATSASASTPLERLRPPPLTPQTEYAREKQRQREMWGNTGHSPPTLHHAPGVNQPIFPSTHGSSKDPSGGQKPTSRPGPLPSLPTLTLREPPKLYQAFPRDTRPAAPQSSTPGGLTLHKQGLGGGDSDSAQFEEEPSELSTLLPDGLANIMAMLDESIQKEEEMYVSDKPPGDPVQVKSYLCAPELIPAPKHQPNQEEFASPPVLSRQGSLASPCSRTSSLNEEDEESLKVSPGVVPQLLNPKVGTGPEENTNYRHSDLAKLYGLPELSKSEADEEEVEEESETPSCSPPPPQRPHLHQTGVNSMFKSLATVLESQKYAYRGGPFGRPPPSALLGVKYSSSLSLGPHIYHQQQKEGASPTSDPTNPGFSPAVPPGLKSSLPSLAENKPAMADSWRETADKRTASIREKCVPPPTVEIKEERLEKLTTISESSLAELGRSCDIIGRHAVKRSLPERHVKLEDRGHKSQGKKKEHERTKDKSRERERDGEMKRKHSHSKNHEERKERKKQEREKRDDMAFSSSSSHSSTGSGHRKRHKEGKSHKEKKDRRILGDLDLQSKEVREKNRAPHDKKKQRKDASAAADSASEGEPGEWTSRGERPSSSSSSSPSRQDQDPEAEGASLGSNDFLKLKALSDGPPKELKIRLIKVESGDRETFIASEVEEKRIPLEEITIKNTAGEIIRACK